MDIDFETKLIECLNALEKHEPIDQILARYPKDAAQLRPMLVTADALPTLRIEPSEAVKTKAREAFLSQAKALRQTSPRRISFVSRILTSFVAVALVCVVLGAGAVAASGSSLPGDPLYGLKRTVENVRLSLADTTVRGALTTQFEQTRIDETEALVETGRSTEVEFAGTIKAMQSDAWLVDKVTVQVNPATRIEGKPGIGRRAQVEGITDPKGLQATSIVIESGGAAPDSTPTPTLLPEPTSTRRPSATPTPTTTSTSTPAGPALEPSVEPTNEPTISTTAEPTINTPAEPTVEPTGAPPVERTSEPTRMPTSTERASEPTRTPNPEHTNEPTRTPNPEHTNEPVGTPSAARTSEPTEAP